MHAVGKRNERIARARETREVLLVSNLLVANRIESNWAPAGARAANNRDLDGLCLILIDR
jgi:hypothetical protein